MSAAALRCKSRPGPATCRKRGLQSRRSPQTPSRNSDSSLAPSCAHSYGSSLRSPVVTAFPSRETSTFHPPVIWRWLINDPAIGITLSTVAVPFPLGTTLKVFCIRWNRLPFGMINRSSWECVPAVTFAQSTATLRSGMLDVVTLKLALGDWQFVCAALQNDSVALAGLVTTGPPPPGVTELPGWTLAHPEIASKHPKVAASSACSKAISILTIFIDCLLRTAARTRRHGRLTLRRSLRLGCREYPGWDPLLRRCQRDPQSFATPRPHQCSRAVRAVFRPSTRQKPRGCSTRLLR